MDARVTFLSSGYGPFNVGKTNGGLAGGSEFEVPPKWPRRSLRAS